MISIVPHPFVPMNPSHSYFWSGPSWLDWCEERFATNLMSQALSRFLVKFDEFYSGRWFPHRKYCLLFYRVKSGKIHLNAWRCSSQILDGHSSCPFDLHQLVEQCIIHYDNSTNFGHMFLPHAFTSTQPCSIIQIMCRCEYDNANTNICHMMWLVRVGAF